MTPMKLIGASLIACGLLSAHGPEFRTRNAARLSAGESPVYRLSLTERTVKAINYQHRSGATRIDFRGTELLPNAGGEARVEGKQGYIGIEAEFDRPAAGVAKRSRVSHLCAVGGNPRRPHGQPG